MSARSRSRGINGGRSAQRASRTVYEDVRERIVTMALPPSTTIDRLELCSRHGVSQSPVREALQDLEREGLVVAYPQSRTLVTRIDVNRLRNEQFLRIAVECEIVRTLAEGDGGETLAGASALLAEQDALIGNVARIDKFRRLDDAFHRTLFEGAGQLELYEHIRSRSGHMARLRTLDLPSEGKMRAVVDDHRRIVNAITDGDAIAAADAMRLHLSGTIDRLMVLSTQHPDLFDDRRHPLPAA